MASKAKTNIPNGDEAANRASIVVDLAAYRAATAEKRREMTTPIFDPNADWPDTDFLRISLLLDQGASAIRAGAYKGPTAVADILEKLSASAKAASGNIQAMEQRARERAEDRVKKKFRKKLKKAKNRARK